MCVFADGTSHSAVRPHFDMNKVVVPFERAGMRRIYQGALGGDCLRENTLKALTVCLRELNLYASNEQLPYHQHLSRLCELSDNSGSKRASDRDLCFLYHPFVDTFFLFQLLSHLLIRVKLYKHSIYLIN